MRPRPDATKARPVGRAFVPSMWEVGRAHMSSTDLGLT
jgi:hypothetical protein